VREIGEINDIMYGTRDASLNWEEEYIRFMESMGFIKGLLSPCLFYHPGKDSRVVVYGGDFTILGFEHHTDWFKDEIKRVYEIDFKARLGPNEGDTKMIRLLNRIIEWKHNGIYMEADPRHAEIMVKHLNLEGCTPLAAPNEKINPKHLSDEDIKELSREDASAYRALAARGNFLSIDRSDIRYTVKELARRMSKPRNINYRQLVHFGRCLSGKMRVVNKSNYQKSFKIMDIWTDTDRAGCLETRKSTTGGVVMMLGDHLLKHWSSRQTIISLSSGEAEYYGCVRAGSQALGFRSMMNDLGVTAKRIRIQTDASVAKSLSSRRGLGGVRHIQVNQSWLQEKVKNGTIEIEKVMGIIHRADALTKPKDGSAACNSI